jgi:hypothetical protein
LLSLFFVFILLRTPCVTRHRVLPHAISPTLLHNFSGHSPLAESVSPQFGESSMVCNGLLASLRLHPLRERVEPGRGESMSRLPFNDHLAPSKPPLFARPTLSLPAQLESRAFGVRLSSPLASLPTRSLAKLRSNSNSPLLPTLAGTFSPTNSAPLCLHSYVLSPLPTMLALPSRRSLLSAVALGFVVASRPAAAARSPADPGDSLCTSASSTE